MDLGLNGKTAFVSGGYRGTGAGICAALASEGARVLVHEFEPGQADDVVASITAAGAEAVAVTGDILTDSGVAKMVHGVEAIDVLVNNFGRPEGSRWSSMDHWAEAWNSNILTAVRLTQLATTSMVERGWGRCIFVGTVGSRMPGQNNPAYYGAKAGLHGIVRSLAQELRGTGVTANVVSPGMIATNEVRDMVARRAARAGVDAGWEAAQAWALQHTMPNLTERLPDPVDIGRVVAFVASEAAWHITGADIAVDGGAVDAR
jgi:3-oxoacyl-[acyl-carrier protein] reductase